MNRVKTQNIALALAILTMAAFISGCGSQTPVGMPVGISPGIGSTYGAGGCMPISQPIGFTTQGGFMDSINVRAGTIPSVDPYAPGQVFGQVMVTAGAAGGPYQAPNNQLTIAPDGSVSMNIIPNMAAGTAGSILGSTATMTGTVSVSAFKQQQVMQSFGGYNYSINPQIGAPGAPAATGICVSGVAISLSHNGYNLYGGRVYLYLNTPTTAYTGTTIATYGTSGRGTIIQF
jgi:hypothetical protein